MGALSIWHILILAIVAVLLFGGRGKISELMGDVAKGIKSFKKGMAEEVDAGKSDATVKSLDHQAAEAVKPRAEAGTKVS